MHTLDAGRAANLLDQGSSLQRAGTTTSAAQSLTPRAPLNLQEMNTKEDKPESPGTPSTLDSRERRERRFPRKSVDHRREKQKLDDVFVMLQVMDQKAGLKHAGCFQL